MQNPAVVMPHGCVLPHTMPAPTTPVSLSLYQTREHNSLATHADESSIPSRKSVDMCTKHMHQSQLGSGCHLITKLAPVAKPSSSRAQKSAGLKPKAIAKRSFMLIDLPANTTSGKEKAFQVSSNLRNGCKTRSVALGLVGSIIELPA